MSQAYTQKFKHVTRIVDAFHQKTHQENDENRDPTIRFFYILLGIHVVFWTVLSTITQPNLPDETLEILTLGQSPAWGYFDQPPLSIWVMSIVSAVFAPAAWPAYLIAQLCIATCLWAAWKLGREFLHPWTAICGALVLEGCFFFTIGSSALTSAHLAGALWALSIVAAYKAFQLENRRDWVVLGVLLGLGILCHYSTVLLFWAMCAFSLMNYKARRCWDTSWPFLAILTAGLIVAPHLFWSWSNDFQTFSTSLHSWDSLSAHVVFALRFIIRQLLAVVPIALLLLPMIQAVQFSDESNYEKENQDFAKQYLLVVTLLPAASMLVLAGLVGVDLGATGLTLWTFAGLSILLWCDLRESKTSWRRVLLSCGAAVGAFAALLVTINTMMPKMITSTPPSSVHFPGRDLAQQVRKIWTDQNFERPLKIIGGTAKLAQNASWYNGTFHRPLAFSELDPKRSSGLSHRDLVKTGGILLWNDETSDQYTLDALSTKLGVDLSEQIHYGTQPLMLQWQTSADQAPITVHWAVVSPRVESEDPVAFEANSASPTARIAVR
ncbi:hypothetical protein KOR42_09250 [Thalassoglobus neptunius]|uniref:Glycosyltransferase RgtA/B/C/D-like domain-containing protein n=1 Tax=Thalassoglobus neptunius TaxID=1938619 RepID=A0A5C5X3G2_9PLAN|nr:glycosyltransferase family 39 protein [Thalassoglobus neptunius]TWT57564.1 hypothetical protein KOR42_09250 [Thalassoglobus neptunius]